MLNDFQLPIMGAQLGSEAYFTTKKQQRGLRKLARRGLFSANLVVDLGTTTQSIVSIALGAVAGSGIAYPASGAVIGQSCDMLHSDTFCNLGFAGCPIFTSGQLRIQVQCSDTDVSGNYTDPTSGLAQLPTYFESGGIIRLNSGALLGGTIQGAVGVQGATSGLPLSGFAIQSGFWDYAGFQRPFRFARANTISGDFYAGTLTVGFVAQFKTTGSGGGYSPSPSSGVVNV